MTAIAANVTPSAMPAVLNTRQDAAQPQSTDTPQPKFKALFNHDEHADDTQHVDRRPSSTVKKRASQDDQMPIAVPFIASPPKLLIPVSFGQITEESTTDATPEQALEKAPDVQAPQAGGPRQGDVAFAAKVVENSTQGNIPVQATPPPAKQISTAVQTPAPAPLPRQAPARTETPQHESDTPKQDTETPQHGVQQQQASAAPVSPTPQNTTFRDAISSSPVASRSVDTTSTAQAQAVEHVSTTASRPVSSQVNEISLRVAGSDQTSASIRLVAQSGELRVAVRSSDPQVMDALRGNVEQLSTRLNNSGFSAEIWKPATPAPARTQEASQQSNGEKQQSPGQDWNGQAARDQNNKQKRPDWVEEFYASNE